MDSNHDKLLQRQLCYRYTIRQNEVRTNYEDSSESQVSRPLICHRNIDSS